MLFALSKGKKVRANKNLPYTREGGEYHCPYNWCPYPELILKKGTIKAPHFAHKQVSPCIQNAEPESDSHIAMKLHMQDLLKIPDEFMEYGKIKGVRPDLLWEKKYAIEVQHSSISIEELQRRNKIYFSQDLIPIWIFHAEEFDALPYQKGNYKTIYAKMDEEYRLRNIELYLLRIYGFLLYLEFESECELDEPTLYLRTTEFLTVERASEWWSESDGYTESSYIPKTVRVENEDTSRLILGPNDFRYIAELIENKSWRFLKIETRCIICGNVFYVRKKEKSWKKKCYRCYKTEKLQEEITYEYSREDLLK